MTDPKREDPEPRRRSPVHYQALRVLRLVLVREGAKVRAARRRRLWTQKQLGLRARLSQQTISQMERGDGATLSLAAWQRVALVLGLYLELKLGRDTLEEPRDAGHLAIEELILRLARANPQARRFELRNRASNPTAWSDVGFVDHEARRIVLYECVNVFGDIGASVRSSDRKLADAQALAATLRPGEPYTVHQCWVVRDIKRNRQLLAKYPEIFETAFPGSTRAWVAALTNGTTPPPERGLIWCDTNAARVFAWRRAKIAPNG